LIVERNAGNPARFALEISNSGAKVRIKVETQNMKADFFCIFLVFGNKSGNFAGNLLKLQQIVNRKSLNCK